MGRVGDAKESLTPEGVSYRLRRRIECTGRSACATRRREGRFQGIMAEKKKFQAIKGTRDLLPPETELWNRVEATAREVFGTFGFGEIRPPIFEPTELFARAVGADTDVVGKEMYSLDTNAPVAWELRQKTYDEILN